MFKRSKINTGALMALGGALLSMGVPVQAQSDQRVEVTGSRIKSIGATSNSPITSVNAEEINSSQPVAIEEIIRGLPAAIPAIGPGTNNGSGGIATIDLRGLGPQRTLVLINGRRAVPADLTGRVDTNAIPVALLERIDLVTGGASAVYGADAVSGVVNFILKRNFSGVEAQTTYGASEQGDAKRYRTDLTVGANLADGRGNVALSFGTTRTNPLTQGERSLGKFSISSTTGLEGGSSITVPTIIGGIISQSPPPAVNPLAGNRVIDPATGALRAAVPSDNFNFNPLNYYITPLERTQMAAIGRFTINEFAETYVELNHTKSKVSLNLAPTGTFASAGFPNWKVPIGSPFIPNATRAQLCGAFGITTNCAVGNTQEITLNLSRRITENGPRINDFDNTTSQWTAGLRGSVPFLDSWTYDGYLQKGTSDQLSTRVNWGSASKLQQALRSVSPTACTVTTGGCVPINVFGAEGTITPAMLGFFNQTAIQSTKVTQTVKSFSLNGDLGVVKSPFAKVPVSLAVGVEDRTMSAGNLSDGPSQINGEVLGTGAPLPDRRGDLSLKEGFIETVIPLAGGIPGIHALNLEGGYRDSKFKTLAGSQGYGSWKYGLDYSPIKGLRLRAMQQRATRSPNINELYQPIVSGLSVRSVDPCQLALVSGADANTAGTLANLCRLTGVPLSQFGNVPAPAAGQISNTGGGNPNLNPEEADTTTIGLVWEPEFVPGLSFTLDFYKIEIAKAVSSATTNQVLDGCYTAALNPGFSAGSPFCGLIVRNVTTGSLNGAAGVITQTSNLGTVDTQGYDLGVSYRMKLQNWGRVDLGLQATQVVKNGFQSLPSVARIECVGLNGPDCGGPTAKVKWSQRTTWSMGDFTAGYNWRYLGKSAIQGPPVLPQFASIKAYNYVDLNFAWQATKNLRLSLAVNNATDLDAPFLGANVGTTSTNSGNTFPQWYDVVGRAYSFGATLKF